MSLIQRRTETPAERRPASLIERFFDDDLFGLRGGLASARLFDDPFFQGFPSLFGERAALPPLNIAEDETTFRVEAELPGLEPDDIDLEVSGNQLRISGERRFQDERKEKDYHRVESRYGSFSRTVSLPGEIRPDGIDASFRNGILTVTLPKASATRAEKIKVKTV